MPRAIASAPGKAFLFGEHAVVYGVTAIAASLSDLRVIVQVETISEPVIEIIMNDLPPSTSSTLLKKQGGVEGVSSTSHKQIRHVIKHELLKTVLPVKNDPLTAAVPSRETVQLLKNMSLSCPAHLSLIYAAACYLAAYIAPECIWGATDSNTPGTPTGSVADPRRGLRISVLTNGLPSGVGLGASAAFSVALAGAMLRLRQLMFGDLLGSNEGSGGATLDDIAGSSSSLINSNLLGGRGMGGDSGSDSAGWCPPDNILHIINKWAFAAEVIFHINSSGLDNTTSCFGGCVRFNQNAARFETLAELPAECRILLTDTNIPPPTRDTSASTVRKYHDACPTLFASIMKIIEDISQDFLEAMKFMETSERSLDYSKKLGFFVNRVSGLCDTNHCMLHSLGIGHPALTAVREVAKKNGLSGKLTGGGGGGCVLTVLHPLVSRDMVEKSAEKISRELSSMGFTSYVTSLGGKGVLWHNEYPLVDRGPVLTSTVSTADPTAVDSASSAVGKADLNTSQSSLGKSNSFGWTAVDIAVALAAFSILIQADLSGCAVLTIAACGLGFALRGFLAALTRSVLPRFKA